MSDKEISVLDLVEAIGIDNLSIQALAPAVTNLQMGKDFNKVTFATQESFGLNGLDRVGIVLWISKEDFQAAKEKLGV